MTHVDLFSGIGGFALAAQWAGFTTAQFVEIDPYCQKVLTKNFPGVPIHDDVTTFSGLAYRGCTLVTFGFPCQDISTAGKGAGLDGARSGLYFEALRIVQEAEPLFVLAENVPALRTRGIDRVLESLEETGYTAEAFVVGAGNAGAPHIRKRVLVVGWHANRRQQSSQRRNASEVRGISEAQRQPKHGPALLHGTAHEGDLVADPDGLRELQPERGEPNERGWVDDRFAPFMPWRDCEPPVLGVVDGLSRGLDSNRAERIKGLGNCVVPAQVYPILKSIARLAA